MVIRYLLSRFWAEQLSHLFFKRTCEEPVYIMVAIIHKHKSTIFNILLEVNSFLLVELHKLVSAQITKKILKQFIAGQINDPLFQAERNGGVLQQRIQHVRRHTLVSIPVAGLVL